MRLCGDEFDHDDFGTGSCLLHVCTRFREIGIGTVVVVGIGDIHGFKYFVVLIKHGFDFIVKATVWHKWWRWCDNSGGFSIWSYVLTGFGSFFLEGDIMSKINFLVL